MPFGAEYAKPARFYNLFLFRVRFRLEFSVQLGVSVARGLLFGGELPVSVGNGDLYHIVVVALFPHTLFCKVFGVAAKQNIGAAPRHIGCDCNRAVTPRLSYYFRLALVILCIEYIVLNAVAHQKTGNFFRLVYRNRTYKHGLTLFVAGGNFLHNRLFLAFHRRENRVRLVHPLYGLIGGDNYHVERVNGAEFRFLRLCRTRHTRKFFVKPEIVLESYGCVRLVFFAHLYVFLGFDSLMKSVGIAPAHH